MAVRASHALGEPPLTVRVVVGQVHEVQHDEAVCQPQRRLHRVRQPLLGRALHREPVHHDRDVVLLLLLQRRGIRQGVDRAVDQHAGVALRLQRGEQVDELALARADHRGEHLEATALRHGQHLVHDLLRRLLLDDVPAHRAVRHAGAGVQQAQVVVDLGDRPDRRARVAVRRLLVDGHRRGQALDEVDVRLVHLPEELPGVRAQRLDVPALALGEDRVEGQARLPRPREAGEDDEAVARKVEVDAAEVVLTGPADDEPGRLGGARSRVRGIERAINHGGEPPGSGCALRAGALSGLRARGPSEGDGRCPSPPPC